MTDKNYQLKSRTVRIAIDEEFGIYDTQTRFDICDVEGKVIDDAQGYGYKTMQAAHKAAAYKFKGGREKAAAAAKFWRKNKDFAEKLSDLLLATFKDPPSNKQIIEFAQECGIKNFDPKLIRHLPK